MIADHLTGIEKFEADLWKIADNLRANSNLASNEYFMPILGLIFLRHATNRYYAASAAIEEDIAEGRMPDRPLVEADFTSRRALMLPEAARYDQLLENPRMATSAQRRPPPWKPWKIISHRSRDSCRRITSASRTMSWKR